MNSEVDRVEPGRQGSDNSGPLQGITILDFTRAMAGPFGTMLLGDLGADVIKVEPPGGDDTRNWAPPFMNGVSSYFLSTNRNKKSICLDLKKPDSRSVIEKLARTADVVIENFRPGTAEKLGIDYESLRNYNDSVIYCSISGYGQTGPYRNKSGFDLTILARSGLMSVTGEPGRPPVKFGVPITDMTAGMFAAISILSALYSRALSGNGQYIDLSMLDANMLTLTHQATSYFATGKDPQPLGSAHASIAPYQVYASSDGYVAVAVGSEKLWHTFCAAMDIESLTEDPKVLTNQERVRNREYLNGKLKPVFESRTTVEIIQTLEASGIPVSPINKISGLSNDEHVRARGMITEMEHPAYGRIESLGTPFKMSTTPGSLRLAPPLLGEHTKEILDSLGFSDDEIKALMANGTVSSVASKASD